MHAVAESFSFEGLEYHGKNVRREVRESIGHPCYGSSRHVVDHFEKSLDLDFGRFGRTSPGDDPQLPGHDHRAELGKPIHELQVDVGLFVGSLKLRTICHIREFLRCPRLR